MTLLHKFSEELQRMAVDPPAKVLVAVSGGVDSMVLLHLMQQTPMQVVVAHCNFQLRGDESDADAQLVQSTASRLSLPFHIKSFHTSTFAADNGISIQMAARKLRYEWFKELAGIENCSCIATAHHAGDSTETVLLNLVKGTGLSGMHGIRAHYGNIIRPLIKCSRQEILAYALEHHIHWREDGSNSDTHYERNFIRHEVLPMLRSINPKADEAIHRHASYMVRYEAIIEHTVKQMESACCMAMHQGTFKAFDLDVLFTIPEPATMLFHMIRDLGFHYEQCETILSLKTTSGAQFISGNWKLTKDRNRLVLVNVESLFEAETYDLHTVNTATDAQFGSFQISLVETVGSDFGTPHVAYLAADTFTFPIQIRRIKAGDRFHPLGMKESKLVSDFFTDTKTNYVDRSCAYAVCAQEGILWVAPFRIDDRFKLKNGTKDIVRIEWCSRS